MIFIDRDRCTGCGYCGLKCPQLTISLHNGKAYQLQPSNCIGCGICEMSCYYEVIMVVMDDCMKENSVIESMLTLQKRNLIFPC